MSKVLDMRAHGDSLTWGADPRHEQAIALRYGLAQRCTGDAERQGPHHQCRALQAALGFLWQNAAALLNMRGDDLP